MLNIGRVWQGIRGKAHVAFPPIAALLVVLILVSPALGGWLSFLHEMAFARFCMFWCLGVCIVLARCGYRTRPSVLALVATAISIAVSIAYFLVWYLALSSFPARGAFFFSCLSGAILGALAGTWLVYALEVYVGRR